MVSGGSINVECLVANLGENLTQHQFRLGPGHHEVHFLALGDPAKPVAVPSLVQELCRMQAGNRDASYTLFPGPCR